MTVSVFEEARCNYYESFRNNPEAKLYHYKPKNWKIMKKLHVDAHHVSGWLFLLFWAIISIPCMAQDLFLSTLGNSNYGEEMEDILQTNDGNLLFSGAYDKDLDQDALLVKTDLSGNVIWSKTYGGTSDDMILDVKETGNNELIAVGWTKSFGAVSYDFWVIKMDSTGNVQWEKRYGGNGDEQAWSVAVDGTNYFVVGGTNSFGAGLTDIWALKLDSNGNVIWQNTYGSTGDDAPPGAYEEYVAKGLVDQNGNYVICSTCDSTVGPGSDDIWMAKLNASDGSIIWQYAYGDIEEDGMWSFTESANGGYLIAGVLSNPTTYDGDAWGIYIDTNGNIAWQNTFGISGDWDEALNVAPAPDGGALFSAYFEQGSVWVASLFKTDNNGNLSFAKQYKIKHLDWTNDVTLLDDGTIAFVGVTTDTSTWNEDIILARTDSIGDVGSCSTISPLTLNVTTTTTSPLAITMSVAASSVVPQSISSTVTPVSLAHSILCSQTFTAAEQLFEEGTEVFVYPNPAFGTITFDFNKRIDEQYDLTIYNSLEQLVVKYKINKNRITWNTDGLAKGIYFYHVQARETGNIIFKGKLIIQ